MELDVDRDVRHVTRAARIVTGFFLIIAGIAMLALPGPGWAAIALGLALLAPHFRWADVALMRLKKAGNDGAAIVRDWWRRFRTRSSAAGDGRSR